MIKTILNVDDSPSVRLMVNFALREAGYSIISAESGDEALRKMQSRKIDMLITDLNMPEMDGISLIKNVRAKQEYKFIPILMLTTESQHEKKNLGKDAGATGWIVKPFNPDDLLGVVKKFLG